MKGLERWKGRVALVTGATAGIGRATAEALSHAGMKVAICARSTDKLEEFKGQLESAGGSVLALTADLRNEDDIHQTFARVRESWGGVDVLINNAGLGAIGTLAKQSPADWRNMLDVNVYALSVCTQEALEDMAGKAEGQIINVSSIAGHRVPPGTGNAYYSATKHAVKAFTDALRMELVEAKSKVRVGMVSPGMVETEFHARASKGATDSKAFYSRYRVLDAADVADAICYMLGTPPHVAIHDIVMRSIEQPH